MLRKAATTRITLRIPEAARALGVGETKLNELITAGDLPARKLGGATIITVADLECFADGLPLAERGARRAGR